MSLILIALILFLNRIIILQRIGKYLLVKDEIAHPTDIVVILRGGTNFERLFEAYEIYSEGNARKVGIPKSLFDIGFQLLKRRDIKIHSGQEQLKEILIQLNIPETDIILDKQLPGGGTYGEALRIKNLVSKMSGVNSITLITSWFHTRRTKMIYRDIFRDSGISIFVHPALRFPSSTPSNWWKYRYQTVAVCLELIKIIGYYFNIIPKFSDDNLPIPN